MPQNRPTEVLVLACSPMNARQLEGTDNLLTTSVRTYHFNMDAMSPGRRPDVVVVRNKVVRRPTLFDVPPANTLLLLSEPHSVVAFPADYVRQFGMVYSCQEELRGGGNVVYGPAAISWFVGINLRGEVSERYADAISYRALAGAPLPRKTREVSVIASGKTFSAGHLERFRFVRRLQKRYGDHIDFFGKDSRHVEDKWEALAPYKYTIALENSRSRFYFTEKISDGFLAGCHVLYDGCTNIGDYFPSGAFSRLDLTDFDASSRVIDNLLDNDPYDLSVPDIVEARHRVLHQYNFLNIIAHCCDKMPLDGAAPRGVVLRPPSGVGNIPNTLRHLFVRPFYQAVGKAVTMFDIP